MNFAMSFLFAFIVNMTLVYSFNIFEGLKWDFGEIVIVASVTTVIGMALSIVIRYVIELAKGHKV